MELLLIVGIILLAVALLGFGGVVIALRAAAWWVLGLAALVIGLALVWG